ncbi:MAG: co-chaperone YbbN [Nocardioidaceae bacterium]
MTVPFSRPGAVDLSGLKAKGPVSGPAGTPGAGAGQGSGAYSVDLDQSNFQSEVQRSTQVPVVLSFWSQQIPVSVQLNASLETLADEFAGRFLFAKVDVDANPQIVQAVGVPGAPLVAVALGGQLAPLTQEAVSTDELRGVLQQVVDTAVANGMTGRVEPRQAAGPPPDEAAEPAVDPRYAEAEDALAAGDLDAAVAGYQKLLQADPGDDGARAGLARAQLVARTRTVDVESVRQAAAKNPTDLEAQISVADVDLLGGHVDDAFDRLVQTVSLVFGEDRDRVRKHLVELFEIVGPEDPRVRASRTRLASALF